MRSGSPLKSFNPTMVRLRRVPTRVDLRVNRFQSHYGAIATTAQRLARRGVGRFNPTMVRLRRIPGKALRRLAMSFNPTMVRLRPSLREALRRERELVSIPLWCDCDRRHALAFFKNAAVSIPLWCDCDQYLPAREEHDDNVSIPLWCDCD